MKHLRLLLFSISTLLLAGAALAQSLPAVVKAATLATTARARAKRVITNDDIPSVVEPAETAHVASPAPANAGAARKPAAAAASPADASGDDEVCQYIRALRREEQQLERRVQKLQASLEKADTDLLRGVYGNALLRLTDSLHSKQEDRADAERTPQGANCSQKLAQAGPKNSENQ